MAVPRVRTDSEPGRRDTESNARLTALGGLSLMVLLAVQGVTILRVHRLITLHFFLGFLLIGPVTLKLGSTGYRFARYYSGDPDYGRAGPPRALLRLAAPFLVLLTVGVFGSGVALAFTTPQHAHAVLLVHKVTFVLWFGVTTLHVLAYLLRAVRLTADDLRGRGTAVVASRRSARLMAVGASLAVGVLLGVLALGRVHPWANR